MVNVTIKITEIMENKEVLLDYITNVLLFEEGNIYDINLIHLKSIKDHFVEISKTKNSLTSYNLSHDFDWLTMSDAKLAIDNLKTLMFLTKRLTNLRMEI